jgi:hypothetical protein
MDLSTKKYLYANGSSVSAGGGFEEYKYRTDIRNSYKNKGIDLPTTQIECSFPYIISQKLGLECINDSKSGGGIDRMIRTTFEWIKKNKSKVSQTIFLLEPQNGIRLDWYIKEWNDFGILNAHLNSNGEYPFTLVKDWFTDDESEQQEWNHKYYEPINQFFNNFYDENVYSQNEELKLIFFLAYLNQKNIDYLISIPHLHYKSEVYNVVPKNKNINKFLENDGAWDYCRKNKWLISDEINNEDNHIGYFGNKKIADTILEIINEN